MGNQERATILVKAWPQPSQSYGETVCCAGITESGAWRRLFPIRFRHLQGSAKFNRWDIVEYNSRVPRDDRRVESRRVEEQSLKVVGQTPERMRSEICDRLIRKSLSAASLNGESLALIRPGSIKFRSRPKTPAMVAKEREQIAKTNRQGSLLDRPVADMEPCPYAFSIDFEDGDGLHKMTCQDWETPAAYFKLSRQYGSGAAIEHLRKSYEEDYVKRGLLLALGTVKKRPKQWLLLGMIRVDPLTQPSLF